MSDGQMGQTGGEHALNEVANITEHDAKSLYAGPIQRLYLDTLEYRIVKVLATADGSSHGR